ncbi:hypothetical protein CDA63_10020 [Hymenobacter amundsenii]|uniref:Uncharacterized protein n=1 Tax=Hymenobacter amundsenii TaxID=2006685 RepID=A0A2D0AFM7_9BACT|nr:hypothetical protein [Hymenobacter amundsenii]OWP63184.1 hypothetical protein CDA63_10020 [Hymenobacter amundsenii]
MILTTFIRATARLLPALGGLLLLSSCDKELDTYYTETGAQYPTFTANALGTASKYATGEIVQFELRFAQQTDPIREIRILQKIEPARDSVLVQTIAYKPAFSRIRQSDTLVVNYTVPAGANKANVRVDAVVVSTNGQTKTRNFSFRLAEPDPTIRLNAATNVTAPAGATPVPGDVVRFPVVLNEGSITSASAITSAGILRKDLDSLITYVKVGTAAERRFARQRVPVAGTQSGAATTVNVDLTLPAGSSGQPVVFRFEAKTRYQDRIPPLAPSIRMATVTAPAITPGTPTALATARAVTLTYTGPTGGDLAAFDLTTFTTVPAAGPATSKDVAITSTATNTVRLQTLNTSRFVASTAAAYNAATLNSIRQSYLTAASSAQLTTLDNVAVGSVYIIRLRGLDQYAIFTVTGLNRTSATDVVVTLAVKAL